MTQKAVEGSELTLQFLAAVFRFTDLQRLIRSQDKVRVEYAFATQSGAPMHPHGVGPDEEKLSRPVVGKSGTFLSPPSLYHDHSPFDYGDEGGGDNADDSWSSSKNVRYSLLSTIPPSSGRTYTHHPINLRFHFHPTCWPRNCCTRRYSVATLFVCVVGLFILAGVGVGKGLGRWAYMESQRIENKIGEDENAWRGWELLKGYYQGLGKLVRGGEGAEFRYQLEFGGREGVEREEPIWSTEAYLVPESKVYTPYAMEENVGCDYNDYSDYSEAVGFYKDGGGWQEGINKTAHPSKVRTYPELRAFHGIPEGFPDPIFGSYEELGLPSGICFDRYGKMGAYGLGYPIAEGGLGMALGSPTPKPGEGGYGPGTMPLQRIDWRGIDWGKVQQRCIEQNRALFRLTEGVIGSPLRSRGRGDKGSGKLERTALLLRTWDDYKYTPEDIANIRSIISELAINTGGQYSVHLLVHVKDSRVPIWSDTATYTEHLKQSVPQEFQGIATLWNEPLMALIYSTLPPNEFRGLPVHGVYRSSFMPVQWFALQHPEFQYIWNWEMDVRYSGHLWEFLDKVGSWAKKQKRRGLWERNERFWIPAVHGSWGNFSQMVENKVPADEAVWGPVPVPGVVIEYDDPMPPYPIEQDSNADRAWGVGEDSDLIVFNPLFNPENTEWLLAQDTTGYATDHPPRRAAIIATSRLSRRLLVRMHAENAHHGHTAFTEMWPATCALHHGFKAVYVPHPVYIDRKWPLWYLEKTFNHGSQGASGGTKESVFGSREHNFRGVSWYYNGAFAPDLWSKWMLGRKGNEEQESDEVVGRMCLRGMLLHPVKKIEEN